MLELRGLARLKNEWAICARSAKYAFQIATARDVKRSNGHIQEEYAGLPNDLATLGSPCVVRRPGGLGVITQQHLRQQGIDLIARVADRVNARRLIEFGCGDGLNIRLSPLNAEFHGFDLVPERVDRARGNAPQATLWVGDATVAQVPDDSFDLAYSIHAIEQIRTEWAMAVAHMRRAAKFVLLVEPFYERKGIHGKLHTRANGYFRGRIRDVLNLGLQIEDEYAFSYWDPWNKSTALLLRRS